MKKKSVSARRVTGIAVLLALVIVLQVLGGYFKVGATSLSFVLVPIVLGGILYGAWIGAFLGFAFGFVTWMYGVTGADPFTAILFEAQPFATTLLCLGKGIAAGLVSGLVYQFTAKKNKQVGVFAAAATAPIVNTGLFIFGSLVMLKETLMANFVAEGSTIVYFLFIGCAGINFLVELAINLIFAPTLYRLIGVLEKGGRR